jgi:hypothetical protein
VAEGLYVIPVSAIVMGNDTHESHTNDPCPLELGTIAAGQCDTYGHTTLVYGGKKLDS